MTDEKERRYGFDLGYPELSPRYTQAEVDAALEWFSQSAGGPGGVLAAEVRVLRSHEALTNNTAADLVVEVNRLEAERDVARTQLQMSTEAHELLERDLSGNLDEMVRMQESIDLYRADLAETRRNAELFNDAHQAAELRIVELRATIARVQALLPKWRRFTDRDFDKDYLNGIRDSADELDYALKGEP